MAPKVPSTERMTISACVLPVIPSVDSLDHVAVHQTGVLFTLPTSGGAAGATKHTKQNETKKIK